VWDNGTKEETRLQKLQALIPEDRASLADDGANYMRSKYETAEIKKRLRKLENQAKGLRGKVEKQKAMMTATAINVGDGSIGLEGDGGDNGCLVVGGDGVVVVVGDGVVVVGDGVVVVGDDDGIKVMKGDVSSSNSSSSTPSENRKGTKEDNEDEIDNVVEDGGLLNLFNEEECDVDDETSTKPKEQQQQQTPSPPPPPPIIQSSIPKRLDR